MIVGIHQPNYFPWLGYFRKIAVCSTFVYFDNVQMPGGKSFTSRNAIKTAQGKRWLTVPVTGKGKKRINEVEITDQHWRRKHLRTIEVNYRSAPHFAEIYTALEAALQQEQNFLADQNIVLIELVCEILRLEDITFIRASCMDLETEGADSILPIISKLGAGTYITGQGPGSMRHLNTDKWLEAGVETQFVSSDFPSYSQKHREFVANLSIIDALFNVGISGTRDLLLPAPPAKLLSIVPDSINP